jgi:hypothetical protein
VAPHDGHHVQAELAEAAQRDDMQRGFTRRSRLVVGHLLCVNCRFFAGHCERPDNQVGRRRMRAAKVGAALE